jgi:hypothetical protein
MRKLVRKIKHTIIYNLTIMQDKISDYDKNQDFSDVKIDDDLIPFVNSYVKTSKSTNPNPNEDLMKQGIKQLYGDRKNFNLFFNRNESNRHTHRQ